MQDTLNHILESNNSFQSIQVRPEQDSKRVSLDKHLLAIRKSLEASNPGQRIDFYQGPWDEWRNEADDGEEPREKGDDKLPDWAAAGLVDTRLR